MKEKVKLIKSLVLMEQDEMRWKILHFLFLLVITVEYIYKSKNRKEKKNKNKNKKLAKRYQISMTKMQNLHS